jgi:hypothetical protein
MAKGGTPYWALGHMIGDVTRGAAWAWGLKGSSTKPYVTHATTKRGVCPIFGCLTIIYQFSMFLPYFNGLFADFCRILAKESGFGA